MKHHQANPAAQTSRCNGARGMGLPGSSEFCLLVARPRETKTRTIAREAPGPRAISQGVKGARNNAPVGPVLGHGATPVSPFVVQPSSQMSVLSLESATPQQNTQERGSSSLTNSRRAAVLVWPMMCSNQSYAQCSATVSSG